MWDERKELNMSARQFLFSFQQADAWRFTFSMMVNTQSRTGFVGRAIMPVQMEVTVGYLNTIV